MFLIDDMISVLWKSGIHQLTPWWYLIYLVTGGEEEWKRKIFFHWRGNRMGKAKEGSIWRRKIFGEWRRSRIDKKREENIFGRIPWVGFLRPSLAWLEDQGRLNDNAVNRSRVRLYKEDSYTIWSTQSYLFDVKNKQQISMFETNFAWTFSNALSFVVKNLPSRKMLITCH